MYQPELIREYIDLYEACLTKLAEQYGVTAPSEMQHAPTAQR
jgi:hypothetical protein